MKKYLVELQCAFSFMILLAIVLMINACGKEPNKPIPGTTFQVNGLHIQIQGELKPASKTTVERAESSVKTAVSILERE